MRTNPKRLPKIMALVARGMKEKGMNVRQLADEIGILKKQKQIYPWLENEILPNGEITVALIAWLFAHNNEVKKRVLAILSES